MIFKAIHLTNFKGIGGRVSVPLAPITLLFGGNSSGKSTILQAYLYLYELVVNEKTDPIRSLRQGDSCLLNGFENLVNGKDLSKKIKIEVDMDSSSIIFDNFLSDTEEVMLSELLNEQNVSFELNEPDVSDVRLAIEVSFDRRIGAYVSLASVSLNGDLFAEIRRDGATKQIWLVLNPFTIEKLEGIYQDEAIPNILSESLGLESFIQLDGTTSPIPDVSRRMVLGKNSWTGVQGLYSNYFVSKLITESILSQLIAGPFKVLKGELMKLVHIGPVRSTPSRGYAPNKFPMDWYRGLAGWDRFAFSSHALKDAVNRFFGDEGFQSKYEFVSKGEYNNVVVRDIASNLYHEPVELGIGLSQVFPVIVACSDESQKFISVEEPELHLHPAWQLVLSDIFISAVKNNSNRMFLIETHSENLMLRFMKRVRLSEGDDQYVESLNIENDDLSVVCVYPRSNGQPYYQRQKITENGEFELDWPEGFFEERYGEL